MKNYYLILLILLNLFFSCKDDTEEKEIEKIVYGKLAGMVVNEYGQPLSDVNVKIDTKIAKNTKTNTGGKYYFDAIPVGIYTVTVSKENFLPSNDDVIIEEDFSSICDFTLKAGIPFLWLSDSAIEVGYKESVKTITVSSNAQWNVKNETDWIEISVNKGEGDGYVQLNLSVNTELDTREGEVIIISGEKEDTIKVKQWPSIQIVEVKTIIGNKNTGGVSDSVWVAFNQPVTLENIISRYELCLAPHDYSIHDNKRAIRFTYGCGRLGGEYPFTTKVKNGLGESFSNDFTASFYDKSLQIHGLINDMVLADDEKHCWIATYSPNKIYYVSVEDFSIVKEFSLDYSPFRIRLNPYNNRLYILSRNGWENFYLNKINVIDPVNGQKLKEIPINPDEYDHPQWPNIYPFDLQFTYSGIGVLLLGNTQGSGMKWQMIDSRDNDRLYYYENGNWDFMPQLQSVYVHQNRSQIVAGEQYGGLNLYFFNAEGKIEREYRVDGKYRSDEYWAGGNTMIRVFHKKENWMYIAAAPGSQCVIDFNTDTYSNVTFAESRGISSEFSYRPQDKHIIFQQVDDGDFFVIDIDNDRLASYQKSLWGMKHVLALKNAQYILMGNYDKDYYSKIYRFQVDDLLRHAR